MQRGLKQQVKLNQFIHFRYRPTQPNLAGFIRRLTDFLKFGGVFGGRIFSANFRRRAKIQRIRLSGGG